MRKEIKLTKEEIFVLLDAIEGNVFEDRYDFFEETKEKIIDWFK